MKCFCLKTNVASDYYLKKGFVISILCIAFSICSNSITAQSRLYLANDDHTDFMWTATDTAYETAFVTMIDAWMANNNATAGNSPDYQTKFDCDGTYWAWAYAKHKTAAQFQNFINQVKSEKIVLPINPLVITYGCVPAEATIRSMYYAGELQRKYNIPFDMALSMENQVMPLGLASIWAGCGAKYSWRGICNCSTQVPDLDSNREKEIYWYRGLDDSGVIMKWYTRKGVLGDYSEARDPDNATYELTNKVNTPDYNYNIAGAFGVGGDDLETTADHLAASAQSGSNASTRVIVSNELDFFRDFEKTYGASLPPLTQTYGNEWEDACASLSEVSANVKRSLEKLRSAEAMATIVARTDPSFANTLDSLRKNAWMSLGLYWEHGFGGSGPGVTNDERAAWERRMQQNFSDYVDQLYTLAKANLANQVKFNSTNERFFVFNPLSWTRTDYTDYSFTGTLPVHVMDVSTNAEVKSQVINTDGVQYIRILASNVPPVGYKIYEIRSGAGTTFPVAGSVNNTSQTIDNDYFTIVFTNRGVITSLIDKTNGNKELANNSGTSQYINNISRNTDYSGNSNSNGSFTIVNSGPVSISVKATATAFIDHETTITVFKDIPRVEINNKETENFGNDNVYTTFSFNTTNISSPTIWHEENGAVINAKKVSNGGHYANRQARYDWLTLNHFAAVSSNGNYGVTLSNQDCYFMQTGNSTIQSLDENTAKIKVLVGSRVDGLGMSNQGNDAVFNQSYSISPYNTYSAVNSMKSALEHQDGFTCARITNTAGILPENNFSFMNITDPNTIVWALKPAEEGMDTRGAIVRVWNLTNTTSTTNFNFNDDITTAKNITHIETDISDASFSTNILSTSIGKNQIKSYRVQLVPTSGALPIGILSFTGTKSNGINKLNWSIDTGTNLSFFNIERSEDGNSYSALGTVQVKSGGTSYTYNDDSLNELKTYYYRLKIFSNSGSFVYSNIVLILVDNNTKNILVYPNPVGSLLKLNLLADKQSRYNILVTDITGKIVIKVSPPLFERGNNYYTINTSTLSTGTYTLIVSNDETKYVRQFVKH
jgi:alpha-mannosidase